MNAHKLGLNFKCVVKVHRMGISSMGLKHILIAFPELVLMSQENEKLQEERNVLVQIGIKMFVNISILSFFPPKLKIPSLWLPWHCHIQSVIKMNSFY